MLQCSGCNIDYPSEEMEQIESGEYLCSHCLSELRGYIDKEPMKETKSKEPLSQNNKGELSYTKILVIIGSCFLLIGIFLPCVSIPIMGSKNYLQLGTTSSIFLFAMIGLSIVLLLFQVRTDLYFFIGGLNLGSILLKLFTIISNISDMKESTARGAEAEGWESLGATIASSMISNVSFGGGWAILIIGAVIITLSPLLGDRIIVLKVKPK